MYTVWVIDEAGLVHMTTASGPPADYPQARHHSQYKDLAPAVAVVSALSKNNGLRIAADMEFKNSLESIPSRQIIAHLQQYISLTNQATAIRDQNEDDTEYPAIIRHTVKDIQETWRQAQTKSARLPGQNILAHQLCIILFRTLHHANQRGVDLGSAFIQYLENQTHANQIA